MITSYTTCCQVTAGFMVFRENSIIRDCVKKRDATGKGMTTGAVIELIVYNSF